MINFKQEKKEANKIILKHYDELGLFPNNRKMTKKAKAVLYVYGRSWNGNITKRNISDVARWLERLKISGSLKIVNPVLPKPKLIKFTPRQNIRGSIITTDQCKEFYKSWDWKQLRYQFLKKIDRVCQCCGASANNGSGIKIVVDHIRPIRRYWHLRLDISNLQLLCDDCNMGKGSWDETDWRKRYVTV